MSQPTKIEQEILDDAARRLNEKTGGTVRISCNSRGCVAYGETGPVGMTNGEYASFNVMHKRLIFAQGVLYEAQVAKRRREEREARFVRR